MFRERQDRKVERKDLKGLSNGTVKRGTWNDEVIMAWVSNENDTHIREAISEYGTVYSRTNGFQRTNHFTSRSRFLSLPM